MPSLIVVDDTPVEPPIYGFMRYLDDEYQKLWTEHRNLLPVGGAIPVGGAYMDPFFRCEAIRGMLGALRSGKETAEAIRDGVTVCEIAVRLWNTNREWQVHRSLTFAEDFLYGLIRVYMRRYDATTGK